MTVSVSVIIPVYNAEKYLPTCLESLMSQTLRDCEFIFVNDGSRDKSRTILAEYRMKDTRIKLINQNNQGVSAARNAGLAVASGEFIGFVDADDYVSSDYFETLLREAVQDDCDAVISGLVGEHNGSTTNLQYNFPANERLDKRFIEEVILPYLIKTDDMNTVCNKLFKSSLILQGNIRFPDGVALGEDGWFNMKFFLMANSVKYIRYSGYYYRETVGSATRNLINKDYFRRALEVYKTDYADLFRGILDTEELNRLKTLKFIQSVMAYTHLYFAPRKEPALLNRYRQVRSMVIHQDVQSALPIYLREKQAELGRFDKLLLRMIKWKWTLGLYGMAAYSRLRAKD